MGRTALLMMVGLGVAMGFIGKQMYQSGEQATEIQYAYMKYTNSRDLARSAVHAVLRTLDKNQTPVTGVDTHFNGGTFRLDSLWSSQNLDTLRIVTRGTYADSTYVLKATLLRSTRPFPAVNSALALRATPVTLSLSGKPTIDGHNYDITGSRLVGSGDLPGIATMKKSDSISVAAAGGSSLLGVPAVKVDTSTVDPLKFLDIYKNNADFSFSTSGTYAGQTWGTSTNPVIVYCNAGDDTSFAIKFSGGCTGYGILVVRGNVQFNGSLNFSGLVVVDGFNSVVSFGASGTPAIVGGIIVAGNAGASVTLKGTGAGAKAVYSSDALLKAKNIGKLRYYSILDWLE